MTTTRFKATAVATIALALAVPATALAAAGDLAIAPKAGLSLVDLDDTFFGVTVDADGSAAFGLAVGYAFTDEFSVELEAVRGGAELTASGPGGTASSDVDIDTVAVYAAYRSPGPVYVVGRLGVIRENLSGDGGDDRSDTGASFGIGGGYRLADRIALELEYTLVEEDVSWLLLSARFGIGLR